MLPITHRQSTKAHLHAVRSHSLTQNRAATDTSQHGIHNNRLRHLHARDIRRALCHSDELDSSARKIPRIRLRLGRRLLRRWYCQRSAVLGFARCICCGSRDDDESSMEMRLEQAWQERQHAREARRIRGGLRYAVPRCHVPKPPPAYVEEIEMA